jgi:hypothetical protein
MSIPSTAADNIAFQGMWSSGVSSIELTGYTQLNPLNLSASQISFGTQFTGGLRLPRYLYLSNNSATPIQHSPVALPSSSPFTVSDRCPTVLEPHTVCQLQLDYESPRTSADSVTLSLDQGASVLVTGRTIPQPGIGGTAANPNLVLTPETLDFPNAVIVTGTSANTQTATVSNTGTQPFPLNISLSGDFIDSTNCSSVLAGGASCSVVFTFTPSQPGARQGLLSVSSGAATTPAYVSLSGIATPILPTNNGTLDLGSSAIGQPVVQWYKITQPLSQLSAQSGGDFSVILVEDIGYGHGQPAASAFTPSAVGSCTNCWLGVQFLPSAAGSRSASLALASSSSGAAYTLTLTGNGMPLTGLLLTPPQHDFGPVAVHSSSAATLFALTNLTAASVNFSAPSITGDFAISNAVSGGPTCLGSVAPHASCFVQVLFKPSGTGPAVGTLTLASSSGTTTATLTGFGSPDPGLALNPGALVFHNVPSPSAVQQIITVTNTGLYDLQIGTPASSSSNFQFTTTCNALPPGTSCAITVTFMPSQALAASVLSIRVTSSAAGNPQTTYTVPLSGTYTAEDNGLQILPGEADYGPTSTSSLGLTRQFLVNNLTTQPIALSLTLPRQFTLVDTPCSTLDPGGTCTFLVSFLPLTNGDITGTLFVRGVPGDGRPPLNALGYVKGFGKGAGSLTITGDLLPGRIMQFGQVASGQTSTRTLTLTNTGSTPVTVRRLTSEWPFLSTTTCGSSLPPNFSCAVTLTYSPLNQTTVGSTPAPFNTDAGSLVIESDAASSPDFIDLTGTVTPLTVAVPSNTAPLVSYTVSQSSLSFASTPGGDVSPPQTVTLTNTSTTTLHFRNFITTPDFSVTGTCPTLVPGASCPITVSFTPQASSSQTSNTVISALEILSDSSTSLEFVSLLGMATPSTLGLSPASLDFGTVLVGVSTTRPIRITNSSRVPAVFRSITVTGDYTVQGDCPSFGSQLAPAAACTLKVTFKPSHTGSRAGSVSVATSLTTLPLSATLTGIGAQSQLQITPSTLAFGDTLLGSTASRTISMINIGTAPVNAVASTITTGDYAIAKPCATTTLVAGASCTIALTFNPHSTGTRSGNLTITSSDPSSPVIVPLTGNGTTTPTFAFSVDGSTASTVKVKSGMPASYHLSLTPQNGYTGPIILNCTPISAGQYATCSLFPSSVTLNGSAQTSVATVNTVTKVTASLRVRSGATQLALCVLPFGMFFFPRGRAVLVILVSTTAILSLSGCGSGGTVIINKADPSLRYTPPGSYQYKVTATSAAGTLLSQTVILNLTVTAP